MNLFGNQSYELYDDKGNLRVRFGDLNEVNAVTGYMYHFTKDGEYVDGVEVTGRQSNDDDYLKSLALTYEGCHVWVQSHSQYGWMQMVAIALPFDRFNPEATANVPECVRTAEYLRDK